ncbi:MAG: leucine-rich repeat domain-containing protein [Clostridia bacterium]|nr:leucine-rich repeat domain-containing protein [Clostridia bacterium]
MKKLVSLFFALSLLLSVIPMMARAEVLETDGGIMYTVESGEVVIQGFSGDGSVMNIPEKIDGVPVKRIAAQTCRGDTLITEVRIPKSVISIGEYAFAECPNLTKAVISGGVFIGRSAFRDCKALLTLKLPDTLESIDDFAFEGCTVLGTVKIPKGLEHIGNDAFMGCERLRFELNGNEAAKEYARKYNIDTSFTDTWEFTLIMIVLVTSLLGGGLIFVNKKMKNKKRP